MVSMAVREPSTSTAGSHLPTISDEPATVRRPIRLITSSGSKHDPSSSLPPSADSVVPSLHHRRSAAHAASIDRSHQPDAHADEQRPRRRPIAPASDPPSQPTALRQPQSAPIGRPCQQSGEARRPRPICTNRSIIQP
ncbi:hypothetical protein ACLOJK_027176 [Asimina triloba]